MLSKDAQVLERWILAEINTEYPSSTTTDNAEMNNLKR